MYRKKWDKETKMMRDENTGNIIVTMKGSKLRSSLRLFGESWGVNIKVRPYIPPVKQYFRCFKFGHYITMSVLYVEKRHMEDATDNQSVGTAEANTGPVSEAVPSMRLIETLIWLWCTIIYHIRPQ